MIKIGIIGYGRRISQFVACLREIQHDIQIVGIVDPDEREVISRLSENDQNNVKFFRNLDELLKNKMDALLIGTRCNWHAHYAIQAAKYDIPLFLEKPIATSLEQAESVEKAFTDSKCKVLVSFPLRLSPLCETVHNLIINNAIGNPEHIEAVNFVPYGTTYWEVAGYKDFSITQGLFLQKATHDFDYMAYLMKSNIVCVGAMWNRGRIFGGSKPSGLRCSECAEAMSCLESPQNRKKNYSSDLTEDHECVFNIDCGTPQSGMNEDCSSAIVEFESGVHGVYSQVFFSRRGAAIRGATISGYLGTLRFDWYKNKAKYIRHHSPFSDSIQADSTTSHFGGDTELAINFIAMIKHNEHPKATIWDGLQSVYACLAAKESAEKKQFIKVRQVCANNHI